MGVHAGKERDEARQEKDKSICVREKAKRRKTIIETARIGCTGRNPSTWVKQFRDMETVTRG